MSEDVRLAFRQLVKSPVFTIVTLLTLALGIGANTTIFSIVNSVILRPLPFPEPARLVKLGTEDEGFFWGNVIGPVALKIREEATAYEHLSLIRRINLTLKQDGFAQKVDALEVSADFLDVFGVQPLHGRNFAPTEDDLGANNNVVILTHDFWQNHFGGSLDVLGTTLRLNQTAREVVGILGPNALLQNNAALIYPQPIRGEAWRMDPQSSWAALTGRLKPRVTLAEAKAELEILSAQVVAELPSDSIRDSASLRPLQDWITRGQRQVVVMLLGGVVLLLLVACANVANLLLARATTRTKEMAVRAALGATGGRLMRQILTESLVLALLGGMLGVLFAAIGIRLLVHTMPVELPLMMRPQMDLTVLFFSVLVACGTGLLVGIVPAWRARGTDVNRDLKESGRGSTSGGRSRTQSLLVIGEVGMTMVLLIGAGLLLRSFDNLLKVDPGFRPASVVAAELSFNAQASGGLEGILSYQREVRRELGALPGVASAATINTVPFSGDGWGAQVWATENPDRDAFRWAGLDMVGGNYFHTMGIPLLQGRHFTPEDNLPGHPPVAILSEKLARFLFPDTDAVGQRVDFSGQTWEVIGVAGEIHYAALDDSLFPRVYAPQIHNPWTSSVVVRTNGPPTTIIQPLRETLRRINSDHAVSNIRLLAGDMDRSLGPQRMTLSLVGVFAVSALGLACLGIYGVMAYTIEQRRRELCIRMALGAVDREIRRFVMRDGLRLAAIGLVAGLLGGFIGGRLIAAQLYEVSSFDPVVVGATTGTLLLLVWISLLIPAWRATRNHPAHALRSE